MKTKRLILGKSQKICNTIWNYCFRAVITITFISVVSSSIAQDQSGDGKDWHFIVGPYLIFPNMNGDVAIKGIPIDVSANPGDIFSNLDFGMMLYFEASNPKWAIIFDGLYMNLGKKGVTPLLSREASVDMDQLAITVNGLYRIAPWFEAGIGGRVNSIGSGVKIAPGEYVLPGTDFSMNETWFDPLIVVRAMTRFNETKWRLGLLADMGGFGVGSDFAWQVNPFVGYQFSKLFEIDLAYRWLGMKYETGSGTDFFLYDITISGAEIGFMFHF